MYLYNDNSYSSIEEVADEINQGYQTIEDIPNGIKIEIIECDEEPMFELGADKIVDLLDEDRFDEEMSKYNELVSLLNKYVDFDSINKEMPKLWYPNYAKKIYLNKHDLIENF